MKKRIKNIEHGWRWRGPIVALLYLSVNERVDKGFYHVQIELKHS
jgi:hypothetical protein